MSGPEIIASGSDIITLGPAIKKYIFFWSLPKLHYVRGLIDVCMINRLRYLQYFSQVGAILSHHNIFYLKPIVSCTFVS